MLLHAVPLLVVFAAILIAYDIAQKYFVFRLLKQADKDEREAIIAALTTRRR